MSQDLGLFAYRIAGRESLATGSALNFAADVLKQGEDVALVIANVGQALWNRRQQQAMTMKSWNALPRKFGVGAPTRIGEGNKVPGHETEKAHVRSVFEFVGSMMGKEAKVQIVGICEGIEEGVRFLDQEWETWKEKVQAIVIGLGYCWDVDFEVQNQEVKDFMAKVCRVPFSPTSQCLLISGKASSCLPGLRRAAQYASHWTHTYGLQRVFLWRISVYRMHHA